MGVRTTPWRLDGHEEDDEGTPTARGSEDNGGGMSDVGDAVPGFIRTFQGTAKDFLMKMSFATVGSANVGVDEVVGVVDPHCPGRPWANPRYPGVPVDVVTSAGRRGIVSGDVGCGGRAS